MNLRFIDRKGIDMSFRKKLIKVNIRIAIIPIITLLILTVISTGIYRHIYNVERQDRSMPRDDSFFYLMLAIIIFVAVLIFICCTVYANRMVRHLMIPLCTLCEGAKRISDGDLSTKIDYTGEDEFETLCHSFNEMQERLADNINRNIQLEQRKQEMIAGISHDLKTPLTAIKGYTRGILDGVANTEEKRQRYLEQIEVKADEMEGLINELFLYSKLETGKIKYSFEICELNQYLKEYYAAICEDAVLNKEDGTTNIDNVEIQRENPENIVHYMSASSRYEAYSNIKFKLNISRSEIFVSIDQDHMNRVLQNIISNSIKYNPGTDLEIELSICLQSDKVILSIRDNGCGVPEDKLPHIFESFYRADEARVNPEQGSGLGLAIVKNIVEAHNGTVTAKNDKGLIIEISLPIIAQS